MTVLRAVDSFFAKAKAAYHRFGLSHVGYLLVLAVYSLIGGLIFRECELAHDLELQTQQQADVDGKTLMYQSALQNLSEKIDLLQQTRMRLVDRKRAYLVEFDNFARLMGYDDVPPTTSNETDSHWELPGAIFYAGTLYTTIGYGSYAPQTVAGRIATIFYSLLGIPLVLTILNDIGKILFFLMRLTWVGISRLLATFMRRRRGKGQPFSPLSNGSGSDDVDLPISGAILIFLLWMAGCAAVFMLFEPNWTFFDAFYFSFISLTTIGLGDFTPSSSLKAMGSIPLLLIGLSVIGLCINVIQANIEKIFSSFVQLINREYQMKQSGSESAMKGAESGASGIKNLLEKRPLRERLLFSLMDKQKLGLLEEKFEKQSNMVNKSTQTISAMADISIQASNDDQMNDRPYGQSGISGRKTNKSYIYNIDD